MRPEVLYCDNHALVLRKPENMPMQPDASGDPDALTWARGYVAERYHKPGNVYLGLVHRLDRPVSGLVVLARTSKAAARLSAQLKDRTLSREYAAAVFGSPPEKGVLRDFLKKSPADNLVSVVPEGTDGAQEAILRLSVQKRAEGLALLRVELQTGRSHQIRVQLSHAGWPIFGDQRYGKGPEKAQIALCARSLAFTHPTTGERLAFETDVPAFFPIRP